MKSSGAHFFRQSLRWLVVTFMFGTLVACTGIKPGKSPWKEFVVDVPVKTAYERAIEQTKYCLVTKDRLPLTTGIAADQKSAFVKLNLQMAKTLVVDIKIKATPDNRSLVLVEMWGVDIWNATAIDAMQAAIQFGVPSCVNYFPTQDSQSNPKKR